MSDSNFVTCTYPPDAGLADTAGWDTVYAVRAPVINQALTDFFSGHASSQLHITEAIGTTASIDAQLGPWQLTTGGSGTMLALEMPILSGHATSSLSSPAVTVPLAGASITMNVTLGFHPLSPPSPSAPTLTAHLKVSPNASAPTSGNADAIGGATLAAASASVPLSHLTVSVSGIDLATADPTTQEMLPLFISKMVENWISANTWIFDYVFLSVDIAAQAAGGAFAWIAPTTVAYAVTDLVPANGEPAVADTIFAIMAMTQHRLATGASAEVSVNAIPTNAGVNAAFLIAPTLIVNQMLMPNMPGIFGLQDASSFVVSSDGMAVSNSADLTLQLQLDQSWYVGNNPATATIPAGDFNLTVNDTSISQTFTNITFPYGVQNELTIEMTLGATNTLGIDSTGHFAMQYGTTTMSTLSVQPNAQKAAWEAIESIAIGLVTTVVLAMLFSRDPVTSANANPDPDPVVPKGGGAGPEPVNAGGGDSSGAGGESNQPTLSSENQQAVHELTEQAAGDGTNNQAVNVNLAPQAETISTKTVSSQLTNSAGTELQPDVPNQPWSLKGMMPRFTIKMWAMLAGQMAGQLWSNLTNIDSIRAYAIDPSTVPTLANFTDNCISPTVWPQTANATLACAGLNGALTLGFVLPYQPPTPGTASSPGTTTSGSGAVA